MARQLLLVRHASTADEYAGRFVGATDLPLGPQAPQQLKALAGLVKSRRPSRCLTSPLFRARQTAEILRRGSNLSLEIDPDLREVDFGQWECKNFGEVCQSHPREVARWAQFDQSFAFPDGESMADLQRRVAALAARVSADTAEVVMAVTHGGIIRTLICQLLGLSPRNYILFDVRCATVTTIDLFEGNGVLAGFNEKCPEVA